MARRVVGLVLACALSLFHVPLGIAGDASADIAGSHKTWQASPAEIRADENPYVARDELTFRRLPVASRYRLASGNALAAIRIHGPALLDQEISGEPIFVQNFCSYFAGMEIEQLLSWLARNTAAGTPTGHGLQLNGSSFGYCPDYVQFFNDIMQCRSGAATYDVGLRGLHEISAVEEPSGGQLQLIDPFSQLALGRVPDVRNITAKWLEPNIAPHFTRDGFHVPSGISKAYYLMAFGQLQAVRDQYLSGQAMQDHSRALFEMRLGWVGKHKLGMLPMGERRPAITSQLLKDQTVTILSRPFIHGGISALQRGATHLFRAPEGGYRIETFAVMPPSFANGWIDGFIRAEGAAKILIDGDFYVIEAEIPDQGASTLTINGERMAGTRTGDRLIVPLNPPRRIESIALPDGTSVSRPVRISAFFLVPDRVTRAMSGDDGEVAIVNPGKNDETIEIAEMAAEPRDIAGTTYRPRQDLRDGAIYLLDRDTQAEVKFDADGWSRFTTRDIALAQAAPDYLDHPHPKWVVTRTDSPASLVLEVELRHPASQIRVGSLGVVSSLENELRVFYSEDGRNFRYLYAHRPQVASSYGEAPVALTGRKFYLKFEALRRSHLLLNERNFVSLSHVFLFGD